MKQIIVTGPSGCGKTYALRKVFGVGEGFGCKTAITSPAQINGYQFLPEVSNGFIKRHGNKMWDFINNGNITVTDVNYAFRFNLMEKLPNAEIIVLRANEDEIAERLAMRNTRNPKQAAKSIKSMNKLLSSDYKSMTQAELIDYLTQQIYGSK